MNCLTINNEGRASQIHDCNPDLEAMHGFRTFISNDIERLKRIQARFRPMEEKDELTPFVIEEMKRKRQNNELGQLKAMIKRYLGIDACCTTAMDSILASL